MVNGLGDPKSKIWLIGEAPGAEEEKTGVPFVGGAGRYLDSALRMVGIKRTECYIDNVMQVRPQGNNFGQFYLDKGMKNPTQELVDGRTRIQNLVRHYKPNVVVAFGNEALCTFAEHKGIMNWRGSILSFEGVKVIPVLHPALVLRQFEFHPLVLLDMNKVKEEASTFGVQQYYSDNFLTNPSYEQVIETLKLIESKPLVAFDIETQQNQITCIGFSWSKEDAICVPIFFSGSSHWSSAHELGVIKAIRELLTNPNVKFIAQNAQFDMTIIKDLWGIEVVNLYLDTMVAFHCLYPELRKGLDLISSIYTKRPYYKGMVGKHDPPTVLWKYNCYDTVVTYESAVEIVKEMEEFGVDKFYFEHSHKLIKPLMELQRRGIRIDLEARNKLKTELQKNKEEMQKQLDEIVGHPLNVSSPKQMKEYLYTECGYRKKISRKTGNETADEETIKELAVKHDNPALALVLGIRQVGKLLSTYVETQIDKDERIRCSYVITGTDTGRLSSRKSIYGSGTNLQNIPRGELIRSLFIPDSGNIFINADLSQAEARVVAFLAKERRLQTIFANPDGDVHKKNASFIFNKKVEDVSDEERQLAKTLVHAANYCIGIKKFAKHIKGTESRARELLNQYYTMYPCIKLWHRETEEQLRKTRILRTPLGRKRMFFGRWEDDLIRAAIAYVPQSTVSDILNIGLVKAYHALPVGWEILMQVHDSVLIQCPKETEHMHLYKFIKHFFEFPVDINGESLIIPVDIKWGENWGIMKKLSI